MPPLHFTTPFSLGIQILPYEKRSCVFSGWLNSWPELDHSIWPKLVYFILPLTIALILKTGIITLQELYDDFNQISLNLRAEKRTQGVRLQLEIF